jgi:hypothetical protein
MSDDYGPPVTQGEGSTQDDAGTPAETTGEVEDAGGGDTPHTPPANTETIVDPGGSPTDEIQELYDPTITSLSPDSATLGADADVTVTGTNFTNDSAVEVDGSWTDSAYVSETELTATLTDPGTAGTVGVSVRNASGFESNTVDFTWA